MKNDNFALLLNKLIEKIKNHEKIIINGLITKQKAFLAALFSYVFSCKIVYVFKDLENCRDNLKLFNNFCKTEILPNELDYMLDTLNLENAILRSKSIFEIISSNDYKDDVINFDINDYKYLLKEIKNNSKILLTTAEILLQPFPNHKNVLEKTLILKEKSNIEINDLEKKLVNLNYERVSSLYAPCQFAIRGDVIDIWTASDLKIRISIMYEEIEFIKELNLETNLSENDINEIKVAPFYKKMEEICIEDHICFFDFFKKEIVIFDNSRDIKEIECKYLSIYQERKEKINLKNIFDFYDINSQIKKTSNSIISFDRFDSYYYITDFKYDFAPFTPQINNLISQVNNYNVQNTKSINLQKSQWEHPKLNDLVVHNVHGIGRYDGIENLEINGIGRDYLRILYAGGDILRIPVENMNDITIYHSDKKDIKINKIGGDEFEKIKKKAIKSARKLAFDLAEIYEERKNTKGYKYSDDNSLVYEFRDSFKYEHTIDQLKALDDCLNDLSQGKIMDRLLCGDVGYGKTEVALEVAFKVISEGKQVVMICPTTILAMQHLDTARKRYANWGIKVDILTRFSKKKNVLDNLKSGHIDFLIGTHRVLSKDVCLHDLGLLIIDEEQRFGVEAKEKIKNDMRQINVLSMSATPIPRTLHLSLISIRDISLLETPPKKRLAIETVVCKYSDELMINVVKREIEREGKVFIVYNDVKNMENFYFKLKKLLSFTNISYAHGQMNSQRLEKSINSFVKGQSSVLLSSTIIENGIDVQEANTMLVMDSNNFGLSQLYQLRGRIGRSDKQAYVYFTYDSHKIINENAEKRLEALTRYTDLGSGYYLALSDLEIRGAGNILGKEQHGDMMKVGYDMYIKLLDNAIKGKFEEKKDITIATDLDMHVPNNYIKSDREKIKVFDRIASLDSLEKMDILIKELTEVYSYPPKSVLDLMQAGLIKNLAQKCNCDKVKLYKKIDQITIDGVTLDFRNNQDLIDFLIKKIKTN